MATIKRSKSLPSNSEHIRAKFLKRMPLRHVDKVKTQQKGLLAKEMIIEASAAEQPKPAAPFRGRSNSMVADMRLQRQREAAIKADVSLFYKNYLALQLRGKKYSKKLLANKPKVVAEQVQEDLKARADYFARYELKQHLIDKDLDLITEQLASLRLYNYDDLDIIMEEEPARNYNNTAFSRPRSRSWSMSQIKNTYTQNHPNKPMSFNMRNIKQAIYI